MAALAVACLGLGVAAPALVGVLGRVFASLTGPAVEAAPQAASAVWLIAPHGFAQISPLFIGFLLAAVTVVSLVLVRARGLAVRYEDTWGCGRIRQTPRMEYTSSAFAEPLRRIFAELYRPTQDLSITAHAHSRYYVQSITYTSHVVPWLESALYDPITSGMHRLAAQVRRLQAGSIHLYLLYVMAALLAALASVWWLE
jgi:hydrogenase-4 component B